MCKDKKELDESFLSAINQMRSILQNNESIDNLFENAYSGATETSAHAIFFLALLLKALQIQVPQWPITRHQDKKTATLKVNLYRWVAIHYVIKNVLFLQWRYSQSSKIPKINVLVRPFDSKRQLQVKRKKPNYALHCEVLTPTWVCPHLT